MKKLIGILILSVIVVCSSLAFTACDFGGVTLPHVHEYQTNYNEYAHWQECSCGDKKDEEEHSFVDGVCSCRYEMQEEEEIPEETPEHTHEYDILKYNTDKHWYECECGDKNYEESHSGGTATCKIKARCSVCETLYGDLKVHEYTKLKYDTDKHWYECSCGEKDASENHKGGTATCHKLAKCSVCNISYGEYSHFEGTLTNDVKTHWYECTCGQKTREENHNFIGNKCSVCEFKKDSEGLSYKLINSNKEYAVIGIGTCNDTEVVIPSTYNNKPVTNVYENAFKDCITLISITIPNSVTKIYAYAFYGCDSLTLYCQSESKLSGWVYNWNYYNLPVVWDCQDNNVADDGFVYTVIDGVRYGIKDNEATVAKQSRSITSINIPSTISYDNDTYDVVNVDKKAFYNCILLTSITVDSENNAYKSIDGDLYSKDGKTLFQYAVGKTQTEFIIPDDVKSIDGYAFYNCTSLEAIDIPNSVTNIGEYSFSDCKKLRSVSLSNSVTTIGDSAFLDCYSLTNITIAENSELKSIGSWAFLNCNSALYTTENNLRYVKVNDNPYYILIQVTDENLTNYQINSNTKHIAFGVFNDCSKLSSIIVPDGVTSIDVFAFSNCDSLEAIEIPNSVTSIGKGAFSNCNSLTSITLPVSVISIGYEAFSNCNSLTIYSEAETQPVGWDTNWNNYNLPVVWDCNNNDVADDGCIYTIVDGVRYSLKDGEATVVRQSSTITTANILNAIIYKDTTYNVTSIDEFAFSGKSYLTNVTFEENSMLESIGDNAFFYCESLEVIVIPNSVTSIGYYTFADCSSLKEITLPFVGETKDSTDKNFIGYLFGAGYYSSNNIVVPTSLKTVTITNDSAIDKYAFKGCTSLTTVNLGESVTSIGEEAFYGCSALKNITIQDTVMHIGKDAFSNCNSALYKTEDLVKYIKVNNNPYYILIGVSSKNYSTFSINSNTKHIGYEAFRGCSSLERISIKNSIKVIDDYAFYGCSSLEIVYTNDVLKRIGDDAFANCTALKNIVIPNTVTSIGDAAFSNCTSLTYNVKDGLKYLGNEQNKYLYLVGVESRNLTTANIDSNCRFIGNSAFYNCSSLTSVVIPDSVTSIGIYAFSGCSSLTIYCEAQSKPSGWYSYWNSDCPVVWGYKG